MTEESTTTKVKRGKSPGPPKLPAEKKKSCVYNLSLSIAAREAIDEYARQNSLKPAEVLHEAIKALLASNGKGMLPNVLTSDKSQQVKLSLHMSAAESAEIREFLEKNYPPGFQKRKVKGGGKDYIPRVRCTVSEAEFMREAARIYIQSKKQKKAA